MIYFMDNMINHLTLIATYMQYVKFYAIYASVLQTKVDTLDKRLKLHHYRPLHGGVDAVGYH